MNLNAVKNFLLDLVFPRYCLGCRKEMEADFGLVCAPCLGKIRPNRGIQCHICGLRNFSGACRNCRPKTNLNGLFAAGFYADPVLREMIHAFKYHSIEAIKEPLGRILAGYIANESLKEKLAGGILVPVPLALRRRLGRGFNQSEILAEEISQFLNCPVVNLLKRKKSTLPQADIADFNKRKENVSGVFCFRESDSHMGVGLPEFPKKIILVDDVSTSGATLEEAARILKEAGVKKIYGLVVAKG